MTICKDCPDGLESMAPQLGRDFLEQTIDQAFYKVVHSALHHVIERDGLEPDDHCFREAWANARELILDAVATEKLSILGDKEV